MDLLTTISFIVSEISDLSETLPLVIWLVFARKKKQFNILGIFLTVSAALKVLSVVTAKMNIHNMPLYHLLAVTEVVIVYCFYSRMMFNKVYVWGAVFLFFLNFYNSLFVQHLSAFNSISWAEDMIVLLIMGIVYLFRLYNDESNYTPLEERPDFIINAGFLIYAGGSLFTYLMGTSILSGKASGFFHNAWFFMCVANIIKNILISYGLWRARLD